MWWLLLILRAGWMGLATSEFLVLSCVDLWFDGLGFGLVPWNSVCRLAGTLA